MAVLHRNLQYILRCDIMRLHCSHVLFFQIEKFDGSPRRHNVRQILTAHAALESDLNRTSAKYSLQLYNV